MTEPETDARSFRGLGADRDLLPQIPIHECATNKFSEPGALSSATPTNFRLPPTAYRCGLDLIASRTRCKERAAGAGSGGEENAVRKLRQLSFAAPELPPRLTPQREKPERVEARGPNRRSNSDPLTVATSHVPAAPAEVLARDGIRSKRGGPILLAPHQIGDQRGERQGLESDSTNRSPPDRAQGSGANESWRETGSALADPVSDCATNKFSEPVAISSAPPTDVSASAYSSSGGAST